MHTAVLPSGVKLARGDKKLLVEKRGVQVERIAKLNGRVGYKGCGQRILRLYSAHGKLQKGNQKNIFYLFVHFILFEFKTLFAAILKLGNSRLIVEQLTLFEEACNLYLCILNRVRRVNYILFAAH